MSDLPWKAQKNQPSFSIHIPDPTWFTRKNGHVMRQHNEGSRRRTDLINTRGCGGLTTGDQWRKLMHAWFNSLEDVVRAYTHHRLKLMLVPHNDNDFHNKCNFSSSMGSLHLHVNLYALISNSHHHWTKSDSHLTQWRKENTNSNAPPMKVGWVFMDKIWMRYECCLKFVKVKDWPPWMN